MNAEHHKYCDASESIEFLDLADLRKINLRGLASYLRSRRVDVIFHVRNSTSVSIYGVQL